jgi:ATP-dependent DNA helicase RecQ
VSTPIDDAALHAALETYFHYPAFRPGQLDALRHVLNQRDTLVVMPTGSGKSLIYQIAALVQDGTALVISPLVALMKDQTDSLTRRGISATFINSTLTAAEQDKRLDALARQQYKIVLVAPERLQSGTFRGALKRAQLSLLAIDEAHCLSQWGHDFRPDYLRIADARREFNPPVTLALTATATLRVQDDIIKMLGLERAEKLVTGFNRENLYLEVLNAPDVKTKLALTREFLSNVQGAGIVYVGTRRDAEEVAEFVRQICKLPAQHYHAGLENDTRAAIQDTFMAGDLPLVVATNAFGMGIDRPDVRFVLHYTMPGTLEAYYQEAGRAGRDGLPARATLIYSPKDTALHESFIANDSPTIDNLRAVHQYLAKHRQISLMNVEQILGLRETTVKVALEQLEAGGLIRREPYDEFGVMRVHVEPLNEKILRDISNQVEARKNHKRRLLGKIVSYAETNACRRRVILDYFGDTGDATAPLCCDNDVARAEITAMDAHRSSHRNDKMATTDAEQIPLTVLEAAQAFQRKIGKGKLTDILKGSKAKDVQMFAKSPHYGKLMALRKSDLENLIQQLFDDGYLKQVGGEYPTLQLTPRGEHALKTRAAIQTNIRPPQPTQLARAYAEREAGGTVALSGQLLAQGLTPEQIAAQRGLTVGTIYSHLAQLIAQGQVDVNQVVPQPLQEQVRAAIEAVGSAGYLAPLKARLPEEVDYSQIRCVVEAWKREQGIAPNVSAPLPTVSARTPLKDLPLEPLREWRRQEANARRTPDYYLFGDETLRRLATGRPQTLSELRAYNALGAEIVERYGNEILQVIRDFDSTETIDLIVECVKSAPGQLPRSGVAKLLVGSESERVEKFQNHPFYGRLKGRSRIDVTLQVDVLIEHGVLKQNDKGYLIPVELEKPASESDAPIAFEFDSALFQKLRAWRLEQARQEKIAPFMIFPDAVLHELAIHKPQSANALLTIKGIGRTKTEKYGAQILQIIAQSPNRPIAQSPNLQSPVSNLQPPPPDDDIDAFLAQPHTRALYGPWRAGWALDFHSRFDGDTQNRGVVGDLAFRYKYRDEHNLARELAARWAELLRAQNGLPKFDAVIPVPPSTPREFDPVGNLARALAQELKITALFGVLVKTRATKPQKEMIALAQKQANVRGAFALKGDVRGKHVLLVDDLYDSGATLQEAARVLQRGGVASIVVLTLTKTIHTDR